GLSDPRGLGANPRVTAAGQPVRLQPGGGSSGGRGFFAWLDATRLTSQPLLVEFEFGFRGNAAISLAPQAGDTRWTVRSSWPHPSFGGEFLAVRREISERGFDAQWAVSSLVSSARAQLLQGLQPRRDGPMERGQGLDSFDVSLVEPLNVYTLTSRAVKYGLLFVALVLMAAFMFELFARLRLHPVQYGLVGLSITFFFLLLLALSEKIAFGLAYAAAAGASTLLLTIYFAAVLRGWKRGLGLGAYVGVLYAALYGLLSSEDNALLLGALLLFGLLGLLMLGTRRVDWYALAGRPQEPAAAPA
ncbi:MAG TPA: cell envelope integrity protein CreD, partial [Ramlibacter sp.]|nr:cell envelope integrity protein CreD [Ramlibacter sp.]